MPEPGDGVGGSNDYTAGSGTRVDTGATRADTAVGDRDNISRDGDQAHGNTCAPVRQINGTVVRVLTLLYVNFVLLTLLVAVPSVQTSQGKGRAKRRGSKVGTKRKRSPSKAATASKTT
ncbi:hypothetical protein GQ600_19351 [Phytophthora cactorum]|nr:hypothetical protein GQ600_19351 [Phytophthora cactorum]